VRTALAEPPVSMLERGFLQKTSTTKWLEDIYREDINEIRAQTNIIQVEHTYLPAKE